MRADADPEAVPWRAFLAEAERRLAEAGLPSPAVDARRLVEQASGYEGAQWHLGLDEAATVRAVAHFDAMLARRLRGEPLQYVLGAWGFRTLDLLVDRRVLIPRPETEIVAGRALDEVDRVRAARAPRETVTAPGSAPPVVVVDLGTGSGAIALSVAAERAGVEVWATDVSPDALDVARANLAGLGRAGTAVRLVEGSWFDALPADLRGRLDVVVSNPPYVAADEDLPAEVRDWEPAGALVSGPTGLEALAQLVEGAPAWLAPGGALVVELAPHQADAVAAAARARGFTEAEIGHDLTGRARVVVARLG